MKEPSPLFKKGWASRRVRRTLAFIGILIILGSVLILVSVQRVPLHEQLRYDPPATLFAPPEGNP
jgi:hypothetical protein